MGGTEEIEIKKFWKFPKLGLFRLRLTAGYFLWMLQRVNMGTLPDRWKEAALPDIAPVEWVSWAPLLVAIVALGIFPRLVFGVTDGAVSGLMRLFGG